MKKILYLFIVFILGVSNYTVCLAESKEELFISESEIVNFDINLNDQNISSKGYLYYGRCFVNIKDFIDILGNKYVELNYIGYDDMQRERNYFCKLLTSNGIYYFNIDNRDFTIGDVDCFRTIFTEKVVGDNREDVFLSSWTGSDSIYIKNNVYVNICAMAYLFDDLGYMTKVDMDNNEVVIKRYNKAAFEQRVSEKYNVEAYSVCNGLNEMYYKFITNSTYDIYSGLDNEDAKEKCQKLLEYIWGISVSEINLKYDSSLDIYIASPKGNFSNDGKSMISSRYENVSPKLIIRAFDGMILYPY